METIGPIERSFDEPNLDATGVSVGTRAPTISAKKVPADRDDRELYDESKQPCSAGDARRVIGI